MQIDWFTFGAQIINFLILVALLRLFLYKPIIEAMNEREQKITSRLEDARRKQNEAEDEAETYRNKQRELNEQRDDLLAEARDAANERRQELIEQAREDANHMRSEWQRAIQREKEAFLRRLRERVSYDVFAVARHALRDLADADLEQQLVNRFFEEIGTLEDGGRAAILRDADDGVEIHSAFELSESQRQHLTEIIHEQVGDLDLHFVTDSDVICGLALVTGSTQIGWNIHDYLQTLQDHLESLLAEQAVPEGAPDSAPEDEPGSVEGVARQAARSAAQQAAEEVLQRSEQET